AARAVADQQANRRCKPRAKFTPPYVRRTKTPPPRGGRQRLFFALALATNTRRTCAHAAACPPWHGFRALALDSPASERAAAWTCAHLRDACHARARAGAAVIAWRRVGGRAVRASVAWAGVLGISRSRHRRCGSQAEQKEETVSRRQQDILALGHGSRVGKGASRARRKGRGRTVVADCPNSSKAGQKRRGHRR
ncbi:hypothetical protein C8J57DRAFT_1736852, partial [Mycena rebaudengoi]